ncbi:uncharacterized protein LOC143620492 [Bidens hawaiensis]|uniref:uncharacterized protein LOC143620492 n=1 Tax=Bidens hawaiensis TaxID=980011 RepID=UPI00404A7FE0
MDKRKHGTYMDMKSTRMELNSILEDIEYMGPSHMTWKQKKYMENNKVASLGGKPPKKQRLPLSVAQPAMKNQKERERKMLQENLLHGLIGGKHGKRASTSHKPADRVLKSTVGNFRDGVLDVKDLLKSNSFSSDRGGSRSHRFGASSSDHGFGKGGKKNHGKKGGRRKCH